MYKLNLSGYIIAVIGRLLVVFAGYLGSVPLMLLFTALAALGQAPWQGDMNAVIASCSEYTFLKKGKRVDGTMYSCTSLGVKLGGGETKNTKKGDKSSVPFLFKSDTPESRTYRTPKP